MGPVRTFGEEIWVRERVGFVIMVAVLIFLFAFTFAILGKGSYEPSGEENASAPAFAVSA
jgi:hypothetical protein